LVTADTKVDNTGFPDAAIATGTFAIAVELPAFDGSVGTAEHAAPKGWLAIAVEFSPAGAAAAVVVAAASTFLPLELVSDIELHPVSATIVNTPTATNTRAFANLPRSNWT
jgi:hypothetical protein